MCSSGLPTSLPRFQWKSNHSVKGEMKPQIIKTRMDPNNSISQFSHQLIFAVSLDEFPDVQCNKQRAPPHHAQSKFNCSVNPTCFITDKQVVYLQQILPFRPSKVTIQAKIKDQESLIRDGRSHLPRGLACGKVSFTC